MKKAYIVIFVLSIFALVTIIKLATIINNDTIKTAVANKGTYTINSVEKYGDIYDCNMSSFVNCTPEYNAIIIPNHISSIQSPHMLKMR